MHKCVLKCAVGIKQICTSKYVHPAATASSYYTVSLPSLSISRRAPLHHELTQSKYDYASNSPAGSLLTLCSILRRQLSNNQLQLRIFVHCLLDYELQAQKSTHTFSEHIMILYSFRVYSSSLCELLYTAVNLQFAALTPHV